MPATISILPEELLVEVFVYYWREDSTEDYSDHICRPELTLSHIDQRWRAISIAIPRLWTRINRVVAQKCLEPIIAYLARSKHMPFDLVVLMRFNINMKKQTPDDISEFCTVIQPHLHLLRKFEFRGYASQAATGKLLRMMRHSCSL